MELIWIWLSHDTSSAFNWHQTVSVVFYVRSPSFSQFKTSLASGRERNRRKELLEGTGVWPKEPGLSCQTCTEPWLWTRTLYATASVETACMHFAVAPNPRFCVQDLEETVKAEVYLLDSEILSESGNQGTAVFREKNSQTESPNILPLCGGTSGFWPPGR